MPLRALDTAADALPAMSADWELEFAHPVSRLAFDYWNERRGGRRRPSRADLDPVRMSRFLPHVGLIEIMPNGSADCGYRVRLAGTQIEQIYGSITGRDIRGFLPPAIEASWRACFETARRADAPVRFSGRITFGARSWLLGELLLAPLGENDQPPSMLFVALATWTEGQSPDAF